VSVDSAAVQKAYSASLGGLPYPVLADFHPKGEMSDSFGVYNEERGVSKRAIVIIDKQGIIRFHRIYEGELPEAKDILQEVKTIIARE
jgi:alkyl hydroperoxide reductase subunit AhpC